MTTRDNLFSLDGYVNDDRTPLYSRAWQAESFGKPWNGWATPVVTRAVLADFVKHSPGSLEMRGDGALLIAEQDGGFAAAYMDDEHYVIHPNEAGLYDLGLLGFVFDHLDDDDTVGTIVDRDGDEHVDPLRLQALAGILHAEHAYGSEVMTQEQYDRVNRDAEDVLGADLLETMAVLCTSEHWSGEDMLRTAVEPLAVEGLLRRIEAAL